MWTYKILFCHVLLFGTALSSPIETKTTEKKPVSEITTQTPLKVFAAKNINNEPLQNLNNAQTEKSATKKRNAPLVLTDKSDYSDDDFYEGRTDDYDDNQAVKAYLYNPRIENSFLDSGNPKVNDYRYYGEEGNRKKTSALDEIFNNVENYGESDTRLTPEDFMMLTSNRLKHRLFNQLPYERWSELDNSAGVPSDSDIKTSDILDKSENLYNRYYEPRYPNWANLPRNKGLMNRHASFMRTPKFLMPIYKRAVL